MDLRYSEQDERFRSNLRAWLEAAVVAQGRRPITDDWDVLRNFDAAWQRRLFEAGYAGVSWPKEYGGMGASPTEELIYYEELARAGAPPAPVSFVATRHGGPTLIAEGDEEQKRKHLPRILRGDEVWCQGFSEPNAGSDLAALRTVAVRDGDDYIVTGQKIWTSMAQCADYCELLVRTDPDAPKHKGISWLIMPMDLAGVEVRPLRTLMGDNEFSELFLDNVRIPVANRVGAENDGWRITNVTLRFERGSAWMTDIFFLACIIEDLRAKAELLAADERGSVGRALAQLAATVEALKMWVKRSVSEIAESGVPGLAGSGIKLAFSELQQECFEIAVELMGRDALSRQPDGQGNRQLIDRYLQSTSLTIAAGSSQIQRNIIAERILGLPREPR